MIGAGLTTDRLANRWGRWRIFWGGGLGMALGAVGLTLGHQAALTIATIFGMAYLGSLLLILIQTTLSDRHGEQRVIALTESNVGAAMAATMAPVVVGSFERWGLGWRGALMLAVLVFVWLALRFHNEPLPTAKETTTRARSASQSLPLVYWAYWLVIYLGVSIEWCLIFWGADFLEKVIGLSQVNAATMMSVFFVAMVVGRFAGSRLSRLVPSAPLLLIAGVITVIGFPFFWLARLAPLNLAGLFVAGLGVANLFPLTLSVALGVVPGQTDTGSARASMGGGVAMLIAPLALGWVADQWGIQNAYGIVAVLAATAASIIFLANRLAAHRCEQLAEVKVLMSE
jgi:fucose permease